MATVIYLPPYKSFGEALGEGLGTGISSGVASALEQKRQKEKLEKWRSYAEQVARAKTRSEALAVPPPPIEDEQDAQMWMKIIGNLPKKGEGLSPFVSDKGDFLGYFLPGEQPEGALPLDVFKARVQARTAGARGQKPTENEQMALDLLRERGLPDTPANRRRALRIVRQMPRIRQLIEKRFGGGIILSPDSPEFEQADRVATRTAELMWQGLSADRAFAKAMSEFRKELAEQRQKARIEAAAAGRRGRRADRGPLGRFFDRLLGRESTPDVQEWKPGTVPQHGELFRLPGREGVYMWDATINRFVRVPEEQLNARPKVKKP